ncbi:MAG TPA: DUF4337 domain-containing protein [Candidatus Acidoferrales bacterium]|jgi:hypothetical protein|nr:DUF4337 domain-containing protein [Candidatus Acidoferrales bacterium]
MADELQELQENAEHGAHEKSLAPVTLTMAIFAVLVAAVSLLGHRAHTEELLLQTKATDQWAYYQAKDIRLHSYQLFLDQLSLSKPQDAELAAKTTDKYSKEIARYEKQLTDAEEKANDFEKEVSVEQRRADRFDLGEVMLEAGLVICSITLMTRKRLFWQGGMILGMIGVATAAAGFLIH